MHNTGSKRKLAHTNTHTHIAHIKMTLYIYTILCIYKRVYIYIYTYTSSSVRTNGLIARDPTFGGAPSLAVATRTQNINK